MDETLAETLVIISLIVGALLGFNMLKSCGLAERLLDKKEQCIAEKHKVEDCIKLYGGEDVRPTGNN